MMAPCCVNASGRFRVPPQLNVANCDIKLGTSSSEIAIQQYPLAAQDRERTGNAIGVRWRSYD